MNIIQSYKLSLIFVIISVLPCLGFANKYSGKITCNNYVLPIKSVKIDWRPKNEELNFDLYDAKHSRVSTIILFVKDPKENITKKDIFGFHLFVVCKDGFNMSINKSNFEADKFYKNLKTADASLKSGGQVHLDMDGVQEFRQYHFTWNVNITGTVK